MIFSLIDVKLLFSSIFAKDNTNTIFFIFPSGFRHLLLVISILFISFPISSIFIKYYISFKSFYKKFSHKYLTFIILFVFTILLFFLEIYTGNNQFDGFDLSGIVDVGWRQITGQKPYIDFICVLPVGFLIMIKYAYQLLGISWNSISILNSFFLFTSFWWLFYLFRNLKITIVTSFLFTLMTEMVTVFIISYWWYNSITVVACIIFLLSAISLLNEDKSKIQIIISYILSLSILVMLKPNISMIFVFFITIILLTDKNISFRIILYSLISALITIIFIYLNGLDPFVIFNGYLNAAERALPDKFFSGFEFFEKIAQAFEFLFLCLCFVSIIIYKKSKNIDTRQVVFKRINLIYAVCIFTGLFQWGTSREISIVSFPLIFIPLFLLTLNFINYSNIKKVYYSCIIFLILAGFILGILRYRIQLVGPFFEVTSQKTENKYFKNCYESPSFNETLNEINTAVSNSADKTIFFGPRLEFSYCVFNVESPKNIPLYWFKGSSYSSLQEPEIISTWKTKSFDVVIIRKNDFMRMPSQLISYIESNYNKKEYKQITEYFKK
jgi:hypothetical protein